MREQPKKETPERERKLSARLYVQVEERLNLRNPKLEGKLCLSKLPGAEKK